MEAGETIQVRGAGGDIFEMDVPADGTNARENFDDAIAKGRLRVVEGAEWVEGRGGARKLVLAEEAPLPVGDEDAPEPKRRTRAHPAEHAED